MPALPHIAPQAEAEVYRRRAPTTHVQVILVQATVPAALQSALKRIGATASFTPLSEALRHGTAASVDAIVVVAPEDTRPVLGGLKLLVERMAENPRATLILKPSGACLPRFAHPATVPVRFASGVSEDELVVRLSMMLDMRHCLDTLHRGMSSQRHSDERATRSYANQLRLASQVQREFLPERLPRFGPVRFSALYRPAEYVSGDIYDVLRLDEEHVGIALADATGHGIPAALLTVFIKRALRGKEIYNGHYRILAPNEVLARLNEDILEANLTECRFVAATYAVLNIRTLELSVARGGSPYPILRRADGSARLLRPAGGVVGVIPHSEFEVERVTLQPGDELVIHSDGVDNLTAPRLPAEAMAHVFAQAADVLADRAGELSFAAASASRSGDRLAISGAQVVAPAGSAMRAVAEPTAGGSASRTCGRAAPGSPPDEEIVHSGWFELLKAEGAEHAMKHLDARYTTLRRLCQPLDDLTALAIHVDAAPKTHA